MEDLSKVIAKAIGNAYAADVERMYTLLDGKITVAAGNQAAIDQATREFAEGIALGKKIYALAIEAAGL